MQFGGCVPSPAFLRRYTGYVEQSDTLIPNLTVEEMLHYTCELKSPPDEAKETKRTRVASAIEALVLKSCANTPAGSALQRGISGGEAKRANIGLALVTSPRVLFLDEPTSGLVGAGKTGEGSRCWRAWRAGAGQGRQAGRCC